MPEDIKIQCENCVYWKNHHCENFSSKWFGMLTSNLQNCGKFKYKKVNKKKEKNKKEN